MSSQLDGRYELRVAADRRAFVFARWHQRVLGRDELRVVAVVAEAAADVVVEAADQVLQRTAASSPSPPENRGQLTRSSREPRPAHRVLQGTAASSPSPPENRGQLTESSRGPRPAHRVLQRTAASSPSPPGDRDQLTGSSREPRPQDSSPKPSLQPATSHRIFFTEFTEATNVAQHTDDISRHRLPPYSSTIYMTNTSFKSSSLPLV